MFVSCLDNVPYLHDLLRQFEDPRQVSNWSNQGQILLDFIEMNEKVRYSTIKNPLKNLNFPSRSTSNSSKT